MVSPLGDVPSLMCSRFFLSVSIVNHLPVWASFQYFKFYRYFPIKMSIPFMCPGDVLINPPPQPSSSLLLLNHSNRMSLGRSTRWMR